jgi:hypothetical protein
MDNQDTYLAPTRPTGAKGASEMQNLYQYEDSDKKLHIEYSTEDGNAVKVVIDDYNITVHDAYELRVVEHATNKVEVQVLPPVKAA